MSWAAAVWLCSSSNRFAVVYQLRCYPNVAAKRGNVGLEDRTASRLFANCALIPNVAEKRGNVGLEDRTASRFEGEA